MATAQQQFQSIPSQLQQQQQQCRPHHRLRRRERMALLFFVGVALHLVSDDNLVIMVSSTSIMSDHSHDPESQHQLPHDATTRQQRRASKPLETTHDSASHTTHRGYPRGAAEALHDDALSQLPTLTSLRVGGILMNRQKKHSWDIIEDDNDVFLPWDSATASHAMNSRQRRCRRRRNHFNISKLLSVAAAASQNTCNATTNNNATDEISDISFTTLEVIEELMDRQAALATTSDHAMANKSIPTSILITNDNTTPTTPIIVNELEQQQQDENDTVVGAPPVQETTNTTVATAIEENANATIPDVEASSIPSPPPGEVDEEEDGEIGSVAVDYASRSAGAIILEKSHTFKGTSNLLNSDRDRYAIAPCQDKKYVVIGLSEDILVKTVKLANYERYSSHLKSFSIWGSQTAKEWVDLGTYEARFGLGEQSYDLIQPSWARYLKFKFLTHYGSEHYCTISQIKVHGRTMVQGFHEQWSESQAEEENEENNGEEAEEIYNADTNDLQNEDAETTETRASEQRTTEQVEDSPNQVESSMTPSEEQDSISEGGSSHSMRLKNESVNMVLDDSFKGDSALDNSSGTCDALQHVFSFGVHNDVLQSASFVLSSTSRIAQPSPSHTIPDIAKGAAFISRSKSSPATFSSHAQNLRDAAARSIGNSPLLSAAVERIQVVATALGDSLDINVSNLGRLTRKMHPDSENDKEAETVLASNGIVDSDKEQVVPTKGPENDASSDSNTESSSAASINTASDTDKASDSSRQQRQANEEPGSQQDVLQDLPPLVVHTLRRLPSSDCLQKLNFGEFQAKMAASRKGGSKSSGSSHAGNAIEPIFKTLTDQIKALQLTLSVHEHFTKSSISCYQRVMADLALEMESIRAINDARILKLERDIQELKSMSLLILFRNLAVGIALALKFLAGLVAKFMVRAEIDVPLQMLMTHLQQQAPTTLASTVCVLVLLVAVLPLRPRSRSSKQSKTAVGKRDQTDHCVKLCHKRNSVPGLVNETKGARIGEGLKKQEPSAVLAQESTSHPLLNQPRKAFG
jgi:hypothetical protein